MILSRPKDTKQRQMFSVFISSNMSNSLLSARVSEGGWKIATVTSTFEETQLLKSLETYKV